MSPDERSPADRLREALHHLVEAVEEGLREPPPLASAEDRAEYWSDVRDAQIRAVEIANAALAAPDAGAASPGSAPSESLNTLADEWELLAGIAAQRSDIDRENALNLCATMLRTALRARGAASPRGGPVSEKGTT